MFYSVGRIGIFLHDADAAAREGNDECAVAESIELTAEGKSAVGNQAESVNGLNKRNNTCLNLTASSKCWARPSVPS